MTPQFAPVVMKWVAAGEFDMGSDEPMFPDAQPIIGCRSMVSDHFQWWNYVKGADWRHPKGIASSIEARMDHPVVPVAHEDAEAYAAWTGKRLFTEARAGLSRKKIVWTDSFLLDRQAMANTF